MRIINYRKQINKAIRKSKNIFLMAHKDLDLDALGSCIGMYNILGNKKKNVYIIIDQTEFEKGVEKVLRELDGCLNIIKGEKVEEYLNKNKKKNLLFILDTNKKNLVQNEKVLDIIPRKIIIDHHETGKDTIEEGLLVNEKDASSTCEIITELIEFYDINLESYYATVLLAGIVLDTNNYTLNTTSNTHYASYYLTCLGASARKVQYLLKQDIDEYTERQKLLSSIETINKKIAITKGTQYSIYRKEDLAKTADTLLYFNNIEASFVIGKIAKDTVGISGRSLGNYNITKVLEKLGGGGSECNGAAVFKKKTIGEVEQLLKKQLKKEKGE